MIDFDKRKRIFSMYRFLFVVFLSSICMVSILTFASCGESPSNVNVNTPPPRLTEDWLIQSSAVCKETGETVSTPVFNPEGWYGTRVPSTVLAALVNNGVYKDIYFGRNLEKIPQDQFAVSWWYRKEFTLNGGSSFASARLVLDGINYSANIWLNGRKIAAKEDIQGAFRRFDLDVTEFLHVGRNVLAVEVFPPKPGDFTIGFVDWNPTPPDKNMGLWRGVHLRFSGAVSLENPFVQSKVETGTPDRAKLTVSAQLVNHGDDTVSGEVTGEIEDIAFSQRFSLNPRERKEIVFTPGEYAGLALENPRLWWPNNLGEPHLYGLRLTALVDGKVSDGKEVTFGIREVSDYINEQGHRGYRVNGKKVLIRGGGWVDDLLLADSDAKVEAQMKYAKHMNLNTIRLEGFWGSSEKLYDLADRYGILLMAGWSCQWEWEEYLGKPVDDFGGVKTPEEMELVVNSLRDQVIWLRNHPSIFVWVLASDRLPRPELEKKYNSSLGEADPTRPVLTSCKFLVSEISGPSAVKMDGPYDYVPPVYWYVDKKHGGAFGFNTETGPGPQPPPLESIERMIPRDNLWPPDEVWEYHCGRNEFNTMNRYVEALNRRYGKPGSVEEFARKAQAANYEAMRAMFEAFGVNKPVATGIIQWMLNSAWPEMYWQLYDFYLMPNGAFYGAKTANQPLNIVYNYGDKAVYVVNDTHVSRDNLSAEVRILDMNSKMPVEKTIPVTVDANGSIKILDISGMDNPGPVFFLDLKLKGADGNVEGSNFYWLSSREDVLDEAKTLWFVTPQKGYADFTALSKLPKAKVEVNHRFITVGSEQTLHVTLKNPGDKIAFFIELRVVGEKSGQSILPVYWDDNYISLLPGETKTLSARFSTANTDNEKPIFKYTGWNLK